MITQSESSEANEEYRAIAEQYVTLSQTDPYVGGFGVILNFTVASIAALDESLREIYGDEGAAPSDPQYQLPDSKFPLLMFLGAYLGETIRRTVGGSWVNDTEQLRNPYRVRLELTGGGHVRPFHCLWLRFKNGKADDLLPMVIEIALGKVPGNLHEISTDFLQQAAAFEQRSALPEKRKEELALFFRNLAAGVATAGIASPDWSPTLQHQGQEVPAGPVPQDAQGSPQKKT